ncbi:MAG: sulfite exporter TauE/SafE family protein [Chitinivibrionales bacterium]|nr:sulfite exporter TauE/SafE family protein [Chitinivibrionales bacterium]
MNTSYLLDITMAAWLGVLTSVSPCPLATNIAAISYIGRRLNSKRWVLTAGLLYMIGRSAVYIILGAFLVTSAQSIPAVASFLQKYMNLLLGPILLIIGVVLLDVIPLTLGIPSVFTSKLNTHVDKAGIWGALILGIVFGLSFCPVSAGLFFGSLFSYALQHHSAVAFPAIYGIGTAVPVIGFAFLMTFAAHRIGKAFNSLTLFEKWSRRITAVVFVGAGLYYCSTNIFHFL